MELKTYQKKVINDLKGYLSILEKEQDPRKSFSQFWNNKGVYANNNRDAIYHGLDPKAPDVCIKVPTGGGKTFIACASLKEIFDQFPIENKLVIWLVPNSAIYEQTRAAFKNPEHPYRQRLDVDFNGNVRFYEYEELLNGQGFNPQTIKDQLSLCVISYAAIRATTKDGRRMYRPNSNLLSFENSKTEYDEEYSGPSLSSVISRYKPVVVLDESHNATSDLSRKALRDLDPSFILELTATPKPESNVISFVSASALKEENMVKIPVFLFGRHGLNDVITSTILFRNELEKYAEIEMKKSGRYVRPIALLQAQPKSDKEAITFDKIKKTLINVGIPEEQIALKLSTKDELKNVDLLSPKCPIRYIITVNALGEGWDCPFAYILSTLATGKSEVKVEQVIGRILRQPGAKRFSEQNLNASYVFSSRDTFQDTMRRVTQGLLDAGFSKKDYRTIKDTQTRLDQGEFVIDQPIDQENQTTPSKQETKDEEDLIAAIDQEQIKKDVENTESTTATETSSMGDDIRKRMDEIENKPQEEEIQQEVPKDMSDGRIKLNEIFAEDVKSTKIPYLMYEGQTFFDKFQAPISHENLSKSFNVAVRCNTDIGDSFVDVNMGKYDARKDNPDVLTFSTLKEDERDSFLSIVNPDRMTDDQLANRLSKELYKNLSPMDDIRDAQLIEYINNFVKKPRDTLVLYFKYLNQVIEEIKKKIKAELEKYRREKFNELVDKNVIFCDFKNTKAYYTFPQKMVPKKSSSEQTTYDKALYERESPKPGFETNMARLIMGCDSVLWWHKIIENSADEFCINGFIDHYPDFVVKTKKGNIVMIETKGSHLNNPDTQRKIVLGKAWASYACMASHNAPVYRYYMVFEDENKKADESISASTMIQYLKEL